MKNSWKHRFEHSLFLGVKTVLKILPRCAVFTAGQILGILVYALDTKHRRLVYSNMTKALGGKDSPQAKKAIVKASFRHFCCVFLDLLHLSKLGAEQRESLVSSQGTEILKKQLQQKKGVLIFTAHFGLWEIAAQILSKYARLNVIARPLDNPLLENELYKIRAQMGSHVIYKKKAARYTLRALRRNEMVAVLIDQNVLRSEGIFIKFFGRDASTTPSLATFFLRTEAPIVPIFCYPASNHKYHLKIMEPPPLKLTGDFSKDVKNITQVCTDIIEKEIKKHPVYWLWFHDRWRTRPPNN